MKRLTAILFCLVSCALFAQNPVTFNINGQPAARQSAEAARLYQEAQGALRLRRLTQARQYLNKIIKDYPNDTYAFLARRSLVQILKDLNEFEEAIILLKEMIEKDSFDDGTYAREMLLDMLYELQRFREAIDLIEAWRKKSPNDIWIERQLARFYLQTGRKDEAWMILENMLERTAYPAVFKDLLELAIKSGEVEKLLSVLEDRRARYKNRDFANFVSDCYLALNRKDKAIEAIKSIPDLDREWVLLKKLADLQMETGKIEDAYETLTKIDLIVKDDWDTLKKMGHCLFLMKRRAEAIEVWRRPFLRAHYQRQEQYMNYTSVLIEHQLYEEALAGFDEARRHLGNPTLFAEEVASVLEALGRENEALNEYIQVFKNGIFRKEVFDKLYESSKKGFDLEKNLLEQLNTSFSIAIRQALVELYFRDHKEDSAAKIIKLVNASGGTLDDFFFDRLNQDALVIAGNFHFDLCHTMLELRPKSTLALKAAILMLDMAEIEPIYEEQAFLGAKNLVEAKETTDAELKMQLTLKLARFAYYRLKKNELADKLVDRVLQSNLSGAIPRTVLEAAIFKAEMLINKEEFARAESLLEENYKLVEKARENIFAANPIGETDYLVEILYEKARLALNKFDFQQTLDLLKVIVENYPESIWVNDALSLALFVTKTSVGDFSMIKNILKARRLAAVGNCREAGGLYEKVITENASFTALITEFTAEDILNSSFYLPDDKVLEKIGEFEKLHKNHYATTDLMEKKLFYLRKRNAGADEIKELMQKFIDRFPYDLRSGRFRKLLELNSVLLRRPESQLKLNRKDIEPAKSEEIINLPEEPDLEKVAPNDDFIDLNDTGDF
ncbi:MAG: hypothetical protein Kow0029_01820 [Candidatus Rifleibacteriota bacterium]